MKTFFLNLTRSYSTYIAIAALSVLVLTHLSLQLSYSGFTLESPSGKVVDTKFPFFSDSSESGRYTLRGTLEMGKYSSTIVRIIPDDEILTLSVNKTPVDLQMIPYHLKRDYTNGFIYDLKPYLQLGKNEIEVVYTDGGGLMGIVMSSVPNERAALLLYALVAFAALFVVYGALKNTKLTKSFQYLFLAAFVIRILYFSVTPPEVRGHDVGAHMEYVEYLAKHWVKPPVERATGGAFFHPPLYYYSAAVVYWSTQALGIVNKYNVYRTLQLFSLVYSMGFIFFGLLLLHQLLNMYRVYKNELSFTWYSAAYWCSAYKDNGLFWVIGALFVFWPVSVIHSVRIGNDPMLYCLLAASLYYCFQWYLDDRKKDLMIASVLAAAAIICKANGEILIAVLGVIGLYKMIKTKNWLAYCKLAILPSIIVSIAFVITILPGLILMLEGKRDYLYISNMNQVSTANIVGNTASSVLWFDVKTFIVEPFTDPYDDRMGRQYFWNYLGKTGIVGEFKYEGALSINTTIISSFLAICMMIYVLYGLYSIAKEDLKRQAPIFLAGFFLWLGVTYMRLTFPVNIDFRYITPALISFCALYAASIITFQQRGSVRLARIGLTMALLFTLSGVTFILALLK